MLVAWSNVLSMERRGYILGYVSETDVRGFDDRLDMENRGRRDQG